MPNSSGTKFGRDPQSHAEFVGRQYAHRDVGMPNLSGTKFGRNGVICHDRFTLACMDAGMPNSSGTKFGRDPQVHAKFVGRQCAHKDVGMPNLSGTKFGRNGVKCHDRFAFACMDAGMPNSSGTKFGRDPQSHAEFVGRQCSHSHMANLWDVNTQ